MSDNQLVVARINGQRHLVSLRGSWRVAINEWNQLDLARRAGRLAILAGPGPVPNSNRVTRIEPRGNSYLAVRSADDPEWKSAPRIGLVILSSKTGAQRMDAVIKRLGAARGVHGHEGGWLYRGGPGGNTHHHEPGRDGCRRLPYQGWSSWWFHRGEAKGLAYAEGRWFATVPVDLRVPDSMLAPALVPACDDCGRVDGTHDPEVEH